MDAPNPALIQKLQEAEIGEQPEQAVDLLIIGRGGATALLTSLFKVNELQQQLPYHLTDYRPTYIADSAWAYPVYGLVAPSPKDPTRPCMNTWEIFGDFLKNSSAYLNPDREIARQALIERAGTPRIKDSLTPVIFSTVDITSQWKRSYFKHYPESYLAENPSYVRPSSSNENHFMNDAVLSSSAYAVLLNEHRIQKEDQTAVRTMDMAFTECHSTNMLIHERRYRRAFPEKSGRKIVCLIFGNNFTDFHSDPTKKLSPSGVETNMADIVKYLSHTDLVEHAEELFGKENVFDLSLMVKQDVARKSGISLPAVFRGDESAILRRYDWTKAMLDADEIGHERIAQVAKIIRDHCKPIPGAPRYEPTGLEQATLDAQVAGMRDRVHQTKRLIAIQRNFTATARPVAAVLADKALRPAADTLGPVAATCGTLMKAAWDTVIVPTGQGIGTWLGHQWSSHAIPWLDRKWEKACETGNFLMTGTHASELRAREARRLSQTRLSEPHMPSGSDHMPL